MKKIKIKKKQHRQFTSELRLKKIDVYEKNGLKHIKFPFSSEFPVERYGYIEILSHEDGCMDPVRLKNNAPHLYNHNWDILLGRVVDCWIKDKVAWVEVALTAADDVSSLITKIEEGILVNVSFGYEINKIKLFKKGAEGELDTYISTLWCPMETTSCTVPADFSVGLGRSEDGNEEVEIEVTESEIPPEKTEPPPAEPPESGKDPAPVDEPANPEKSKPIVLPKTITERKPMTPEEIQAMKDAAANEAQLRVLTIGALCKKHGMEDFAEELIRSKKSLQECKDLIYEKIEGRQVQVDPKDVEIGLGEREKNKFSIVRALYFLANQNDPRAREAAAFEIEVSMAAQKRSGKTAQGILLPFDILNHKRDLSAGGGGSSGGYLVGTEHKADSFIEMLRNKSILNRVGAKYLTGLKGPISVPRQSGAGTAYHIAEGAVVTTESALALGQVGMSPKTVGAYTDYTRQLLIQSSPDVDALVNDDLSAVVALAIDYHGLYGSGAEGQPTGLKLTDGINTKDFGAADPTFVEIVDMETKVSTANAAAEVMKYIMHSTGRGALKTTPKFTSTGTPIWEPGNTVNGYGAEVSNQVISGDFFFGNWADMLIGLWSGLDLTVDKSVGALSGSTRIIALQDYDIGIRHPESFTRGNNTL